MARAEQAAGSHRSRTGLHHEQPALSLGRRNRSRHHHRAHEWGCRAAAVAAAEWQATQDRCTGQRVADRSSQRAGRRASRRRKRSRHRSGQKGRTLSLARGDSWAGARAGRRLARIVPGCRSQRGRTNQGRSRRIPPLCHAAGSSTPVIPSAGDGSLANSHAPARLRTTRGSAGADSAR